MQAGLSGHGQFHGPSPHKSLMLSADVKKHKGNTQNTIELLFRRE